MSVDNASVKGMDFSDLVIDDPDLYMVQWTDGKGEIERQEIIDGSGDGDRNLNGLREAFIDVTPFAGTFQQFLIRMKAKNLLLDQAKKIQIELINELFNSKRQLPFHYEIAAGNYWWDASDGSMFAAMAPAIQNVTATTNALVAALNTLIANINANIITIANTGISPIGNTLVAQINSNVVGLGNAAFGQIDAIMTGEVTTNIVNQGNALITHLNDVVLSVYGGTVISVNYGLRAALSIEGGTYTVPAGISGDIAHTTAVFSSLDANPYRMSSVTGTFVNMITIPGAGVPPVSTSNVLWIPIGATEPVTVTPAEQAAILQGIAARTNELNLVRNQKIAEVNALDTVDDVIAYDILADWPIIELPPGYKPAFIAGNGNTSVAMISAPAPPSGGIPEAPNDGVTYGRRNMAWNPALAKSNDVLDGGNF